MAKLPVWAAVKEAYRAIFVHWRLLLGFTWLPLLLMLGTHASSQALREAAGISSYWAWYENHSAVAVLANLIENLIIIAIGVLPLVPTYRLLLIGPTVPAHELKSWRGPAYKRLLIFVIALDMTLFGPPALTEILIAFDRYTIILDFLFPVFFCLYLWCSVKLTFLGPVLSLGKSWSLAERWRETRGNYWRIFGALLVAFLPFLVTLGIVSIYNSDGFGPVDSGASWFGLSLIMSLLALAFIWLGAAVAVVAFAALTGYPAKGVQPIARRTS